MQSLAHRRLNNLQEAQGEDPPILFCAQEGFYSMQEEEEEEEEDI